jgi:glycosyltransferase involved in cell wall biosynthesis
VVLEKTDYETINSIKQFNCQIIYQENKGYGDALILGLEKVRTEYFCIFNADGSFNPNEIMNMYSSLQKKNGDIVFASRYEKNATSEDDTIVTIIGNFIFTLIGKVFFNLPITDILYTFLIGKTNKVKRLNLKSNDFQFCVELPIKAQREKYKIFSIESHERTRIAGKKKVNALKDGFLILKKMVFMFFKR